MALEPWTTLRRLMRPSGVALQVRNVVLVVVGLSVSFAGGWMARSTERFPVTYLTTVRGTLTLVDAVGGAGCLAPPRTAEICGRILRTDDVPDPVQGKIYTAHTVSIADTRGGLSYPYLLLIAVE